MQILRFLLIGVSDLWNWPVLTLCIFVMVMAILIVAINRQRSSYVALCNDIASLTKDIEALEAEVAKLVEQVSKIRNQVGVPTIERTREGMGVQIHNPTESIWQKLIKRIRALISKLRPPQEAASTLADLKVRLGALHAKVQAEGNRIKQLSEYLSELANSFQSKPANRRLKIPQLAEDKDEIDYVDEYLDQISRDSDECLPQDEYGLPLKTPSQESSTYESRKAHSILLRLYNEAVIDNQARQEFRERYKPIRIGTVNAIERRQNPTAALPPEFKEATDGDFFAVALLGENDYAVVPRLGLTIGAVSYNAGALGEIFGNPKYDSARSYSCYCVHEPAIFKHDNDRWIKVRPGELDLGPPD